MKLLSLFLHPITDLTPKDLKSLIDAVLGQDDIILDDVGWWSRFNKGRDGVDDFDIGHGNIMEETGTNNQVDPYYGAYIGSFIISVDGGRIL